MHGGAIETTYDVNESNIVTTEEIAETFEDLYEGIKEILEALFKKRKEKLEELAQTQKDLAEGKTNSEKFNQIAQELEEAINALNEEINQENILASSPYVTGEEKQELEKLKLSKLYASTDTDVNKAISNNEAVQKRISEIADHASTREFIAKGQKGEKQSYDFDKPEHIYYGLEPSGKIVKNIYTTIRKLALQLITKKADRLSLKKDNIKLH